jgi:cytoskeletal protein RodZ
MSPTIGQQLKKAREARYVTLEKAAEETRIRLAFLQALESDDYSVMPSSAQGRGFLRNYAAYLDINIDEMIAELQKNAPSPQELSGPLPQVNLVETDLPPLTDSAEEKKSPPFWTSWLAWFQRTESTEEQVSVPVNEDVTQIKVQEPSLPVEAQQNEVKDEAQPSLLTRLVSFFRIRVAKSEADSEMAEETNEPLVKSETQQIKPTESPAAIFAEIGKKLRQRREMISLNIDEVERHTHMRAAYIKALEEGAFDKLPSPVQTRGLLSNYATFLDLDADTILLRFADALQARHREKYSETPREKIQTEVITSMPILRSFIAGDLIFGVVMIAIIFALAVWGLGRALSLQKVATVQGTAPSIVEVLAGTALPTPTVDVTFLPVNDAPIATGAQPNLEVPTLEVNANVVISIFAVERTFMRVFVDGQVAFEGRIAPGEVQVYQAENQIEILTGNAAALRITYNGHDLGLMGNVGEVISRVYTIAGVVTPTSTVPPTPTATRLMTVTPTPTVTRTPTLEKTATP